MSTTAHVSKVRGRPAVGPQPMSSTERSRRLRAQIDEILVSDGCLASISDSVLLQAFERAYRSAGEAQAASGKRDHAQVDRIAQELLRRRSVAATKTRPSNPQHQRLFQIPQATPSTGTELAVQALPKPQVITGDTETDAMLWLVQVCKTATDTAVLDKALEASTCLTTPAKELENRYSAWLMRQPGANTLQAVFGSLGIADIKEKVERARKRLQANAEGLAVFGTYEAAMEHTPAEQMLMDTVHLSEDRLIDRYWGKSAEQLADIFADSVNPTSLVECVAELQYWQWLYDIRLHVHKTQYPSADTYDPTYLVLLREHYVEDLLLVLKPFDMEEKRLIADALQGGLLDTGSMDDWQRRATVLDWLIRA